KFAQCETCLDPGCAGDWIDLNPFHAGEIDDDATIAGSSTGETVTSTTDGNGEILATCELDGTDDIADVGTACNQGWILVNHPIPDPAGAVVAFITGADQFAS